MKKLILALILLFGFSFDLMSQEEVEDESLNSLEDVNVFMDDIGNRFVYAFFGREMLIYYLDDTEHKRIAEEADVAVLNLAAAPFNPQMYTFFIQSMFKLISFVYLAYFLVRLLVFMIETGWLTKREGVMPMKNGEFRQFSLRFVLLSGLVLFPVVGGFNGVQVGIFDLYGKSAVFGNRATTEIIDSQRQSMTTIRLPKSDAKHDSGLAVNAFLSCLRLSGANEDSLMLSMKKDEEASALWGTVGTGDCHLEVTIGIDESTDEMIKRIKRTFPEFDVSEGAVLKAQLAVFPELLSRMMTLSTKFTGEMMKPREHITTRDIGVMRQWTEGSQASFDDTYWEGACDSFYNWAFPKQSMAVPEMQAYHFMSGRCLSYEVNKSLLYPESYGEVAKFLADDVLKNREIMLCHDSLSVMDPVIGVYAGIGVASGRNDVTEVGLSACIFKQCSDASLASGSLYTCSNAISLYKRALTDKRIKDMGGFVLGAYMFNLYTQPNLSDVSKQIFNGFSLKFSYSPYTKPTTASDEEVFSMTVAVPPKTANHPNNREAVMKDILSAYLFTDISSVMGGNKDVQFSLRSMLYLDRLSTCVRNPLEVSNGYVCGNVPQEINKWGMNLVYFAASFKTMLAVGDAYRRMSNGLSRIGSGGSVGAGKGNGSPVDVTGELRKKAVAAISVIGLSPEVTSTINILGVTYNVDDSFGHLEPSQSTIANMLANPLLGYLVSEIDNEEKMLMTVLDIILGIIFLMGFFLGVVIPFMPVMIFMTALGVSVFLLFKVMLLSSFKLTDIIFSMEPELMSRELEELWAEILAMVLKIPLTVVGVIIAWLMSNVLVSKIMVNLDLETVLNLNSVASSTGLFDAFVIFLVTSIVLFAVFSTVISVIESFYEFTVKWVVGDMPSNPFDAEKGGMNWAETKQSFKHMIAK